jgi:hypothetical protein
MIKKVSILTTLLILAAGLLAGCSTSIGDQAAQEELETLNTTARELINQPGWVHLVEHIVYDIDKPDRGSMSNGTVVPLEQTVNIWYHINDLKQVYQYVWEMTTLEGEPVETIVYLNNLMYNLTTNVSETLNPYNLGALDYKFSSELEYFIANNKTSPKVESGELDGVPVRIFTLEKKLDEATSSNDFSQPITHIGTIATFDSQTGLLLRLERTVTLEDGSKRTFYTDRINIEIGVLPPDNILLYVSGFW